MKRGDYFGRWTIVKRGKPIHHGKRKEPFPSWVCRCECGAVKTVLEASLISGRSSSCGCFRKEKMAEICRTTLRKGTGSKHASWKGGRQVTKRGYVEVWIDKTDPFFVMARSITTSGDGYVFEHRLVMAKYLKRPLLSSEEVHHINGHRSQNDIGNLQLRVKPHGTGVVYECADCGSMNICPKPLS
jgi:hypothetical protein